MTKSVIDYSETVTSHFPPENGVIICLFPFYRRVFADDYGWQRNLKLTYPLLSIITWKEVSKDIGFNSLNRLAQGILELREPFKTELTEYCEWKKIDFPNYGADEIPEVILIPLLQYVKTNGSMSITTKSLERFPGSTNKRVEVNLLDKFDIYNEIHRAKCIEIEGGLEILLPDFDCPYAIISGNREDCIDFATSCELEYFVADSKTRFDWWNQ